MSIVFHGFPEDFETEGGGDSFEESCWWGVRRDREGCGCWGWEERVDGRRWNGEGGREVMKGGSEGEKRSRRLSPERQKGTR